MKAFLKVSTWTTSLLLLLACAFPAAAAQPRAQLHVSATVTPWLEFSARQHIRSYEVDTEDLDRGFIDLPGALTIQVQSNIRHPIAFRVLSSSGQPITIRESGSEQTLDAGNLLMVDPPRPREALSKSLDIRVMLSENVEIGRYALATTLIPEAY